MPIFDQHTIIQHYLRPEEFVPYYKRARTAASNSASTDEKQQPDEAEERIKQFYDLMASMKLMKK